VSRRSTDEMIATLAAEARPVKPLAPPLSRALLLLGALGLLFAGLIAFAGDFAGMLARYAGDEAMMAAETGAMLATGVLAICGAFALSVPGGSRGWLLAPLPSLVLWVLLSGAGCYQGLMRHGLDGWGSAGHPDCLIFILVASLAVGIPVLWLLSRARPIEPTPVATLGGLGIAALAAFLLQFFHPFAITMIDLGFHGLAVLIVIASAALLRRLVLRPA
jgi:hypothetical protein